MVKIVVLAIAFGGVFAIGLSTGKHLNTSALQGCEIVASQVSEDLSECQWEASDCQYRLNGQIERNKNMFETFLPNHLERTQ